MTARAELRKIGFVGLGGMGRGMVKNLIEKGYAVRAFDRSPAAIDFVVGHGAVAAANPAEAATGCDVLIFCVSTAEDVEAVLLGDGGTLACLPRGAFFVDHTTSKPETVVTVAAACARAGVRCADAPVTRTPQHAWDGKLNVLLGANDADRLALEPLFSCYAEKVFHVGPVGNGTRFKLIHNYIAMANIVTWCESLALAAKEGLDLDLLHSIISGGGANSNMFQIYARGVLDGNFSIGMTLANARKDMRYFARWAESVGLPAYVAEAVHQSYVLADTMGHGAEGCHAVIKPTEVVLSTPARSAAK
jgi:3-hydroxyisobutyrate dehydrogenase-like beta-hydroxyacid dehydrogenase